MAANNILCCGIIFYIFSDILILAQNTQKSANANSGRSPFVFSAKNQFKFSSSQGGSPSGKSSNGGSQGGSQQNSWKPIPFNSFEGPKQQQQQNQQQQQQMNQQQQQQQMNQQGQQQMNQPYQGQQGSMGFQNGQQFNNPTGMNGQQQQQQQNGFNQPLNNGQGNSVNQMTPGFNQMGQTHQFSNMNPGQMQMFQHSSQQQQQQQPFGQQNNVPNGFGQQNNIPNNQMGQHGQGQFGAQQGQPQFGGQALSNGVNVLSQNKPSNVPPFQGMNNNPNGQQGFQGNQQQGQMQQNNPYNPQPNVMGGGGHYFNQMPGQQGQMVVGQGPGLPGQQMMPPSPYNQMPGQNGAQMSSPPNNNFRQMPGPMPGQPGFHGQGPRPNLAVIDHPVTTTTTTTTKPPTSTVDGEGLVCMTTADCEIGCCFNNTGQLLDTTTYGAGGPKEGRSSGRCFIRSPGLGDVCDDLCPCQMGHECYRRYVPNYPKPGEKPPPPIDPEAAPKPQRKCLRSAVVEAERSSFWRCYFDVACSGPLP